MRRKEAELPHAPFGGIGGIGVRHLGQRGAIALVLVVRHLQLGQQPIAEQRVTSLGLVALESPFGGQPGERVGPRGLVVEPLVTAEDLVGGFPAQRDRGVTAQRRGQQVQRSEHVPAHREVERAGHRRAVHRVHELLAGEHQVGVLGADVLGEFAHERRVRGVAHGVGGEVLRIAGEIDGEGAHRSLAGRLDLARCQRGYGGGVQPAGQQRAHRNIGAQLPFDAFLQHRAHRRRGGLDVVGVFEDFELPVPPRPRAVAGKP